MNLWWHKLSDRFSSFSQREKLLISLCGLVAIGFGLYVFLLEPRVLSIRDLNRQLQIVKAQNQQLQGEILVLTAKLKKDPDRDIDLQLEELEAESDAISQQLTQKVENLVSPEKMAGLLEEVLSDIDQLRLKTLQSMPAKPILTKEGNSTGYYVHPVRIEISGGYFDILRYLEQLENVSVKYYWQRFKYEVTDYPQAEVVLEVYTLGSGQEFISG
ncbi:type II secretion system protein GspM [Vibrio sonorensis]|uniref:type II secretion system protein GspM n=1 Tax=Vibrio sonorensis TaxID=1004316 RepID=UPI0008DB1137|nr:type II secretion system protein GspM [Vibrio sonorensis]